LHIVELTLATATEPIRDTHAYAVASKPKQTPNGDAFAVAALMAFSNNVAIAKFETASRNMHTPRHNLKVGNFCGIRPLSFARPDTSSLKKRAALSA
jgi:hypothetical protein